MNIFDWLKSKSELKLSDDNSYIIIIEERDAEKENDWKSVPEVSRKLMLADLYILLFSYPSQVTRSLTSQGFEQSESVQNAYRDKFLTLALDIYRKYDPEKYEELSQEVSRVIPLKVNQSW